MNQPIAETPEPTRWWKVDRTTIHAAYILTCVWFAAAAAVYQAVHMFSINIPISTVGIALVKTFVATFLFSYVLALPIVVLGLPVLLFGLGGKVVSGTTAAMLGMSPNGLMTAAGVFLLLWIVQAFLLIRFMRWVDQRAKP